MRLEKTVLQPGDTILFPTAEDIVKVEYTLWMYDERKNDKKGRE